MDNAGRAIWSRGTANAPDPPNHTVDINFYGKLFVGQKQMTGTCP